MRAIDTNVLVRLVIGDDPEQVGRAESFVKTGAWVSVLALAETTCVLGSIYALGDAQLAATVEMLLHHKDLTLQDADVVEAALALPAGIAASNSERDLGYLNAERTRWGLPAGLTLSSTGTISGTPSYLGRLTALLERSREHRSCKDDAVTHPLEGGRSAMAEHAERARGVGDFAETNANNRLRTVSLYAQAA